MMEEMEDDAYKPDFMDIMLAIAEFIVCSTFFGVIIYYTLSGMIESGISGLFVGFFIGLPLGFFAGIAVLCCLFPIMLGIIIIYGIYIMFSDRY